ncbi:MAG: hypothetical protein APR54_05265 [Candidatus Cloacimonas sp. SDB]|nr:MAG: hypothetical protein APR54_05265 [Candidatus Cloacimonas sp. SDB]
MKDLEKILSKALPDKIPSQIIAESGKEIHHLTEGEYLDKPKKVFHKQYTLDSNFETKGQKTDSLNIPEVIARYAGIPLPKQEDLLFIDTETTGLAGGTGTYIFLVGLGYFRKNSFQVDQLFLTDIDGEESFLRELHKYLAGFTTFVSYNGKSFDIPLLSGRYIFNQSENPTVNFFHLDLLHLSRRIWKNSLTDCTLGTIEKEILGLCRQVDKDIPGLEIPQEYFYYLQSRDATDMVRVLHHNYYDVISMYLLLSKLSIFLTDTDSLEFLEEILGMAKLFAEQRDFLAAEKLFRKILQLHPQHKDGRKRLSYLYKNNCDLCNAVKLWERAAEDNEIYAFIELAKHYEHRLKNYETALKYTQNALKIVYSSCYENTQILAELQHRLNRLENRLTHER